MLIKYDQNGNNNNGYRCLRSDNKFTSLVDQQSYNNDLFTNTNHKSGYTSEQKFDKY